MQLLIKRCSFIIDGLDSLLLMDLPDEYARAREWIQTKLSFDVGDKHHAFEVGMIC